MTEPVVDAREPSIKAILKLNPAWPKLIARGWQVRQACSTSTNVIYRRSL